MRRARQPALPDERLDQLAVERRRRRDVRECAAEPGEAGERLDRLGLTRRCREHSRDAQRRPPSARAHRHRRHERVGDERDGPARQPERRQPGLPARHQLRVSRRTASSRCPAAAAGSTRSSASSTRRTARRPSLEVASSIRPHGQPAGATVAVSETSAPSRSSLLLVLALLLFGAKRLPEIGRSLGTGMREFKNSVSGVTGLTGGLHDDDKRRRAAQVRVARRRASVHALLLIGVALGLSLVVCAVVTAPQREADAAARRVLPALPAALVRGGCTRRAAFLVGEALLRRAEAGPRSCLSGSLGAEIRVVAVPACRYAPRPWQQPPIGTSSGAPASCSLPAASPTRASSSRATRSRSAPTTASCARSRRRRRATSCASSSTFVN